MFSFLYSLFLGFFEVFPLSAQGADTVLSALLGKTLPPVSGSWIFGALLGTLLAFPKIIGTAAKGFGALTAGLFRGTFKWRKAKKEQMASVYALVCALPLLVMLLVLLDTTIGSGLGFIGLMFLASAALLFIGDHTLSQEISLLEMKPTHVIKAALSQAVALLPGLSRTGVTLGMTLNMGFRREDAFDFAVVLTVPALLVLGLWNMSTFAAFGALNALLSFAGGAAGAFLGGMFLKGLFKKDLLNIAVALGALAGAATVIFSFVR